MENSDPSNWSQEVWDKVHSETIKNLHRVCNAMVIGVREHLDTCSGLLQNDKSQLQQTTKTRKNQMYLSKKLIAAFALALLLIATAELYNGINNLTLQSRVVKLIEKENHNANLIDLIETKDYRREHTKQVDIVQKQLVPLPPEQQQTVSRFGN